ncbi:1351_t:CDS:1, partial [Racocetra persica]
MGEQLHNASYQQAKLTCLMIVYTQFTFYINGRTIATALNQQ